jgi:protein phosphatase
MLAYARANLRADQREYLGSLPLAAMEKAEGLSFFLCHAAPSHPLFRYITADSPRWERESELTPADIVLTGHTHIPFLRPFGERIVANPGSIGQPRTGSPLACYAVWDRGLELRSYPYECEATVRKIEKLAVPQSVKHDLARVLKMGGLILQQSSADKAERTTGGRDGLCD